jgi:hypothetical protein
VYNNWDTVTNNNGWNHYQRWNNYGFAWVEWPTPTTSSTKVDATWYWPWNYYSNSTFIIVTASPRDRSNVHNDNLWGATTWVITTQNAITNTGVLSVNGQAGDVTWLLTAETVLSWDSWTTYTIKTSSTAPAAWTANNIITFVTQ